jgi:hypothetical protein
LVWSFDAGFTRPPPQDATEPTNKRFIYIYIVIITNFFNSF